MAAIAHDRWRIVAGDSIFAMQRGGEDWTTSWRLLRAAVTGKPSTMTLSAGTVATFGKHRAAFVARDGTSLTISGDDLATLLKKQRKAKLQIVAFGSELRLCAA